MVEYSVAWPQGVAGFPDLMTLFGLPLGLDTTGNFAMSLGGLAVRTPDGRFVMKERGAARLLDVSTLVLPIDPHVYRLPSRTIAPNDLIVTGDVPNFAALYVLEIGEGFNVEGLDVGTGEKVSYCAPRNVFVNYYVRAVSLLDMLIGGSAVAPNYQTEDLR
jgi:hypothetical protein